MADIERLVNPRTKVLYIETPTNPTLRLVDLHKAIAFAKEWDLISLIDNTFASPVLQKPLALGFDLVMHSATKYLAGHSDVIAGAAAGSHAMIEKIRDMIIYLGGSMDPEAAFLLIRGMKTLELRVRRQGETALAVREISGEASEGRARALSGAGFASGSQAGEAADEGIWGDDGVRLKRRLGGGAAVLRQDACVPAGGEPGRRGVAGGAADVFFALPHVGGGVAGGGSGAGDGAGFDRAGGCGGFD